MTEINKTTGDMTLHVTLRASGASMHHLQRNYPPSRWSYAVCDDVGVTVHVGQPHVRAVPSEGGALQYVEDPPDVVAWFPASAVQSVTTSTPERPTDV